MAAYVTALGTFAGQLTASIRRVPTTEARNSFFRALLAALAARPC
jgi:hypothetical protein